MNASKRIKELEELLTEADTFYYNTESVIMEDCAYDKLYEELKDLTGGQSNFFSRVGAPIGGSSLEEVAHRIPMGSLHKAKTVEEVTAWVYTQGLAGDVLFMSYKMDGASLSLEYLHGELVRAATRGDGVKGEDVTANARRMLGVPVKVKDFTGFVRGEVILTKNMWRVLDPDQLSNPRNLGNGIMRRKSGENADCLRFYAFDTTEAHDLRHMYDRWFESVGFTPAPGMLLTGNVEEIEAAVCSCYDKVNKIRNSLDFEIDGLVIEVNDIDKLRELGVARNCPRGMIALKFEALSATTKLVDVEVTVGHTGAIIPTAVLSPVKLGGVTIRRASLCNWEEVKRLGIKKGDSVLVTRRNDVIPKIERVTSSPEGAEPIEEPTHCPCAMKFAVLRRPSLDGTTQGAITYCSGGAACGFQKLGKIKRWVSSLDIKGLGDVYIAALYATLTAGISSEAGLPEGYKRMVEDPSDLYGLQAGGLSKLVNAEGTVIGTKQLLNIYAELDKTRELTVAEFLGSLGIDGLGKRRVEQIIDASNGYLNDVDNWFDFAYFERNCAELGIPNMHERITNGIVENSDLMSRLREHIDVTESESAYETEDAASFCFTGALPNPRDHYRALLEAAGHVFVASYKKGINYLVAANPDSGSSKLKKARKDGVEVISVDMFEKIING